MESYYVILFKGYGAFAICAIVLAIFVYVNSKIDDSDKGLLGGVNKLIGLSLFLCLILSLGVSIYTHLSAERDGAICNDLWVSHSTGSGTCSSHDGVKEWTYKYWYEE